MWCVIMCVCVSLAIWCMFLCIFQIQFCSCFPDISLLFYAMRKRNNKRKEDRKKAEPRMLFFEWIHRKYMPSGNGNSGLFYPLSDIDFCSLCIYFFMLLFLFFFLRCLLGNAYWFPQTKRVYVWVYGVSRVRNDERKTAVYELILRDWKSGLRFDVVLNGMLVLLNVRPLFLENLFHLN